LNPNSHQYSGELNPHLRHAYALIDDAHHHLTRVEYDEYLRLVGMRLWLRGWRPAMLEAQLERNSA
jgi:hypothetical protein